MALGTLETLEVGGGKSIFSEEIKVALGAVDTLLIFRECPIPVLASDIWL